MTRDREEGCEAFLRTVRINDSRARIDTRLCITSSRFARASIANQCRDVSPSLRPSLVMLLNCAASQRWSSSVLHVESKERASACGELASHTSRGSGGRRRVPRIGATRARAAEQRTEQRSAASSAGSSERSPVERRNCAGIDIRDARELAARSSERHESAGRTVLVNGMSTRTEQGTSSRGWSSARNSRSKGACQCVVTPNRGDC